MSKFRLNKRLSSVHILLLGGLFVLLTATVIYKSFTHPIIQTKGMKFAILPTVTPSLTPSPTLVNNNLIKPKTPTPTATPKPNQSSGSTSSNTNSITNNTESNNSSSTTIIPSSTPASVSPTVVISTTTSTPVAEIVSLSTNNVNLTLNRGENRSNVFSFTSSGASQFTLYGYPTTYGAGINWGPSSGGMSKGDTINVSINVNSNVPAGNYSGTGILKFQPGNVEKTVTFSVEVKEAPSSDLGFTVSSDSVNITLAKGSSTSVFTFTSKGSTSYSFYGYPTSYGAGINWGLSSGGMSNGQNLTQEIQVNSNTPAGTYTGTGIFRDETTGAQKSIPVSVTVTN